MGMKRKKDSAMLSIELPLKMQRCGFKQCEICSKRASTHTCEICVRAMCTVCAFDKLCRECHEKGQCQCCKRIDQTRTRVATCELCKCDLCKTCVVYEGVDRMPKCRDCFDRYYRRCCECCQSTRVRDMIDVPGHRNLAACVGCFTGREKCIDCKKTFDYKELETCRGCVEWLCLDCNKPGCTRCREKCLCAICKEFDDDNTVKCGHCGDRICGCCSSDGVCSNCRTKYHVWCHRCEADSLKRETKRVRKRGHWKKERFRVCNQCFDDHDVDYKEVCDSDDDVVVTSD